MERKGLLKESLTKFFSGVILLGALLFESKRDTE